MIKESEAQPGKYGPEHEHRPGEQCPVSACTWPLEWRRAPLPKAAVMPLRPSLHDQIEAAAAAHRESLMETGRKALSGLLPVRKAGPVQPEAYRRTWPGLEVTVTVPHPEPLVRARPAREVEVPSAARRVRKLMEEHGWRVQSTYALGWVLGARGDVRSLTHTLALRAQCGDGRRHPDVRYAVAVWACKEPSEDYARVIMLRDLERDKPVIVPTAGWKFDMAYGWGAGTPQHKLSAEALKTWIKEG